MIQKAQQRGRAHRWITVYNTSGEIIPAYAAVEVVSVEDGGVLRVRKPSADSLAHALITGSQVTGIGDYGVATNQFGAWAAYDTVEGEPTTGDYLGTVANSWKLELAKRGFLAWGGATTNEAGLVQVQRELNCAGVTGSGSGSGGGFPEIPRCCCGWCQNVGCDANDGTLPSTLEITATVSGIGTHVLTLNQDVDCVTGNPRWTGSTGTVDGGCTDCTDEVTARSWTEQVEFSATVRCYSKTAEPVSGLYGWSVSFTMYGITGWATLSGFFPTGTGIDPADTGTCDHGGSYEYLQSCSPFQLSATMPVACTTDTPAGCNEPTASLGFSFLGVAESDCLSTIGAIGEFLVTQ